MVVNFLGGLFCEIDFGVLAGDFFAVGSVGFGLGKGSDCCEIVECFDQSFGAELSQFWHEGFCGVGLGDFGFGGRKNVSGIHFFSHEHYGDACCLVAVQNCGLNG